MEEQITPIKTHLAGFVTERDHTPNLTPESWYYIAAAPTARAFMQGTLVLNIFPGWNPVLGVYGTYSL